MNVKPFSLIALAAVSLAGTVPAFAEAADKAELEALRAQVQQLEQQLQLIKRQLDAREALAQRPAPTPAAAAPVPAVAVPATAAAPAPTPAAPKITINDKGFTLASGDGANSIKLRGLVQMDSRHFFDEGPTNDTFVLRRARMITEGTFAKNYEFQLVSEFGGTGSPSILDATIAARLTPSLLVRFGRFKTPVGLERLQSDSWTFFNERSIVTNLTPDRDLGIQASGDVLEGRLNYAIGVFGGLADAASTSNSDYDGDKDIAARLMASPFKLSKGSPLQGLSFGLGASSGDHATAAGRTSGYRSDGQQTFFTYQSGVIADGRAWRLSPQLDYRHGPFGLIGEYVVSSSRLRPSATGPATELKNTGWQIAAAHVLTGEDSSYAGVTPRTNFDWSAGTWGAFEVAARYSTVRIDDAAFPAFASPSASAEEARAFGIGFNWYLSKVVRFSFDYYHTDFRLNGLAPVVPSNALLRQDEQAFISRFQLSF